MQLRVSILDPPRYLGVILLSGRYFKDGTFFGLAQSRPIRSIEIHSATRLRICPSSGYKSPITATESAPASIALWALERVIPPIATTGRLVSGRRRRSSSSPTAGSGFSFEEVPKIGPKAR